MTELSFVVLIFEDGTTNAKFTTIKTKTDTPTISQLALEFTNFKLGRILEIGYRLNPAAAETYTLMIFEASEDDDYASNSRMLYESENLRADDIDYRIQCDIPFKLETKGLFWLNTDWTGVPGNTTGYLRISGVAYI